MQVSMYVTCRENRKASSHHVAIYLLRDGRATSSPIGKTFVLNVILCSLDKFSCAFLKTKVSTQMRSRSQSDRFDAITLHAGILSNTSRYMYESKQRDCKGIFVRVTPVSRFRALRIFSDIRIFIVTLFISIQLITLGR